MFDGRKTSPYLEDDAPNPVGVYGISKLAGELFVRGILERHYIVRTGPLFGGASRSGVPTNFVLRMLHQVRSAAACHVVTDQRVSPTYTLDLARKIGWLITTNAYGLYHISNAGECSWYELAQAIFEAAAINADLRPIQTAALGVRSHRLAYAVLGHGGLRRLDADDLPSLARRFITLPGRVEGQWLAMTPLSDCRGSWDTEDREPGDGANRDMGSPGLAVITGWPADIKMGGTGLW